jgi:hypothetical protein
MIRMSLFIFTYCCISLISVAQTNPSRFLLHAADTAALRRLIAGAGDSAAIKYSYGNAIVLSAYPQWVQRHLLQLSSIVYLTGRNRKAREEVIVNGFDYTTNHVNTIHNELPVIDGAGTVVSVKEEGPDTTDIDLKGRIQVSPLQSPRVSSHATIMSTIIAGAGNSFYTAKGVAWGASLTSSSFEELLPDSDAAYRRLHITVQNHSYGTGIENYYGAETAAYDASVNNNPSLLHVFSSGNSGDQADSMGLYKGLAGWANLTGNFKMAKNILTVGSCDSFYRVPLLSSKGPAYDGRIKPELVAYGEDGSSGAAALVSGTALLLQQVYQRQHNGNPAEAALVKALLLNTAGESGNPGIDYSSGFGSLDSWRAVTEMQAMHFFSGTVSQGNETLFPLTIPATARKLKLLLCWTDPPAIPNAARALVNDLDLSLTNDGAGQSWLPWVLNSAANKDSLDQLPVRKRDSLNNIEQITVDTPAGDDYIIHVRGRDLHSDGQSFFVAYQWDTAGSFRWMYPTASDNLLPGQPNIIRWQTNLPSPALLEYRLTGEEDWKTIQVLPGGQYLSWSPPDTTALALLRLTADGHAFVSDTFTISPRLLTGVGFNCPDSSLLYWNKMAAAGYALYQLGDRYLQLQRQLTDTSVILPVLSGASTWYAIAPVLPGNRMALRSYAFDLTQQGVACYVSSFTADAAGATAVLQLDLGSLYSVGTVVIEKVLAAGYRPLAVFTAPSGLHYEIVDSGLTQGLNVYRARVTVGSGVTIYSDLQTVYYTGGRSYFLYPNPVYRPGSLHIIASGLNNPVIRIFSVAGQLLFEKRLTNLLEEIPTGSLSGGVYFYSLETPGGEQIKGKIIVL